MNLSGCCGDCQRARSLTVLLISHHLDFIRRIADRPLRPVPAARSWPAGAPADVLGSPGHAYTREIAAYLAAELMAIRFRLRGVSKSFRNRRPGRARSACRP